MLHALLVAALGMTQASSAETAPIRVETRAVEGATEFVVIGLPREGIDASYELSIENGGNRNVHRGSAKLNGGGERVLATIRMGGGSGWTGRLHVTSSDGTDYIEVIEPDRG